MKETEIFHPANSAEWRKWLSKNHRSKQSVWLVFYSKASGKPSLTWSEAVDVALCYGWIDSRKIRIDEETSHQFFSKRKPKSTWSRINKEKIQKLIDEGLMRKAGLERIEAAKQNGSWSVLDGVEELEIPKDLGKAFRKHKGSRQYFMGLSKSVKKMMLHWIIMAKKPETREKRIEEIANLSGQGMKPAQFR